MKSSSAEFEVLLIVTWICTMKPMRNRSVDPPLDLRSLSDLRNLECDMFYEPELNFLLNNYNFVTEQKSDDFGQYPKKHMSDENKKLSETLLKYIRIRIIVHRIIPRTAYSSIS